jgi:rhodanese-related sulfurtransferase
MANKQQSGKISKRMQKRAEERRKKRKNLLVIAVAVALVVILGGTALVWSNSSKQQAQGALPLEVSVEEAYQLVEEGAFLLDVRTQEEWDEFHAPQATLIPLDELPARVNEVPNDQDVVVICRSGNRSQTGRDILQDAGFTNVASTAGGMNAWAAAGYPTE